GDALVQWNAPGRLQRWLRRSWSSVLKPHPLERRRFQPLDHGAYLGDQRLDGIGLGWAMRCDGVAGSAQAAIHAAGLAVLFGQFGSGNALGLGLVQVRIGKAHPYRPRENSLVQSVQDGHGLSPRWRRR